MTKTMSDEKLEKLRLKREKELAYWQKQKARPKGNFYFWYLVLIIALIYAVDEIASQIGALMQTEIANDFFVSDSAVTLLNLLQVIAIPFQIVGIFYRPLADRFGRKTSQMSGQVSRGSAGEYQADEWAGIARTSWRLSVR